MFSHKKRRKPPEVLHLNITSMLDVLTIILFFLLKYFSSTPAIAVSKNLELPVSTSLRPTLSALNLSISKTEIAVEGEPIVQLVDSAVPNVKMIPASAFKGDPDLIVPLLDVLKKKRSYANTALELDPRLKFYGDCIVQADKATPYTLLRKVLYTAGQADYVQLNFAVLRSGE